VQLSWRPWQIFEYVYATWTCIKAWNFCAPNFKWGRQTSTAKCCMRHPKFVEAENPFIIWLLSVCGCLFSPFCTTEKVTKDTWCAIFTWQKLAAGERNKWWLHSWHFDGIECRQRRHIQITCASSIYEYAGGIDMFCQ